MNVTILNLRAALAQKNLATVAIHALHSVSFLNRVKLFPIATPLDFFQVEKHPNLYSFLICVCILIDVCTFLRQPFAVCFLYLTLSLSLSRLK